MCSICPHTALRAPLPNLFVRQIVSFEKSDFHEINYKPDQLVGAARVWMAFEPVIQALFPIHHLHLPLAHLELEDDNETARRAHKRVAVEEDTYGGFGFCYYGRAGYSSQ